MKRVAVGIIGRTVNNDKEYLLVSSILDFGKYTGFFYPPGGHIMEGETEKSILINKCKQELGIDVIPEKRIAETPGDIKGQTTYWWQCNWKGENVNPNYKHIKEFKWLTKEEILEEVKMWPATKKFFKDFID